MNITNGGNPAPGANDINPTPDFVQTFSEENRQFFTERGLTSEQAIIDALKAGDQFKGVDLSKMVAVPGDDAKPEDVMAVYDKLGRPAKPEEYGLQAPEGADPAFLNAMLPIIHNAGLTKRQALSLVNGWNEHMSQENAKANEAYAKAMGELKAEWAGNYDANIAEAKRAAAELGVEKSVLENLEKNVVGSKGLWKLFYNISKRTTDGTIKGGGSAGSTAVNLTDPAQAAAKLKELMADKTFADKIVKNDPEAVKLFNDLHAAQYGDRTNG